MAKKKESKNRLSARKRAEEHEQGGSLSTITLPDGVKLFGLKAEGTKRINIIPFKAGKGNPWADEGMMHFERTFWVHRSIGADKKSYVCPAKTASKPCPICEHQQKLRNNADADEDEQELIKSLYPKERQLWCIENVSPKDGEEGEVQIWELSYHLFGKQLDARIKNSDEDENYEFFADPEEGFTLKIGVAEKSFAGNTFYEVNTIDFKEREPLSEEILEQAVCLDDILKIPSYADLKKVFLAEGDEDEDDDPKPKGRRNSSADEDDDDDAPPKAKSKKTKVKEEDDEDDEDDAPPAKKKKSKDTGSSSKKIVEGTPVEHEEWGICLITKIASDGTLTLEDEDGDIHKRVDPDDVKPITKGKKAPPPDEDDEDEDEDASPPKKTSKKSTPPPDEDDEDEDEDEDEPPSKKKKSKEAPSKKKKKPADDDDDEDIPF